MRSRIILALVLAALTQQAQAVSVPTRLTNVRASLKFQAQILPLGLLPSFSAATLSPGFLQPTAAASITQLNSLAASAHERDVDLGSRLQSDYDEGVKSASARDTDVRVPEAAQKPRLPLQRKNFPLESTVSALIKQPFMPSAYSKPFLKSLTPPADSNALTPTPKQLVSLRAALADRTTHMPLAPSLFGPLQSSKEKKDHAVFLGVFYNQNVPAGYFAYLVKRAKDGALEGEICGVYFDKSDPYVSGIADAILNFLALDLDPIIGVQREVLKADTVGRYVWAKKGFQFDEDYRYYDIDGKKYKTSEIARRSLGRFLKSRRIPINKLVLGGKPIVSLEELKTPADFAELEHLDGKTIRLRPLVNHEILGEESDLPIGKAFMLASYLPQAAPYVLSRGGPRFGAKFAPDAMPWWKGFRELARP